MKKLVRLIAVVMVIGLFVEGAKSYFEVCRDSTWLYIKSEVVPQMKNTMYDINDEIFYYDVEVVEENRTFELYGQTYWRDGDISEKQKIMSINKYEPKHIFD